MVMIPREQYPDHVMKLFEGGIPDSTMEAVAKQSLGFIGTILAWLRRLFQCPEPASFGIIDDRGEMYFVPADRLTVTEAGRLLFWQRNTICAAVAENKWERVLKGITLDDMETED